MIAIFPIDLPLLKFVYMKTLKLAFYCVVTCLLATSCKLNSRNEHLATTANKNDTAKMDGHPAWIEQGNIYEVNVRQYTPEGTFKAFEKNLPRLKEMGVQTLWFMPINPISQKDRKGILGSYYAVSNYNAINPEFGSMDDWKALVKKAHDMGFKIIIDWVPNHTGADHYWLEKHPAFYEQDSMTHQAKMAADWTDTRKLNYANTEMQDSMINAMKFWITETNIDGFRCDVATGPTQAFWMKCIPTLKKLKNIFLLGEGNEAWLHKAGFDATYPWDAFAMMKLEERGERPAFALDSVENKIDATYPANAIRMFFTSNHDENSWNKADYGTMPGASHAPFAVLTQTYAHSVPLIYGGQEEPFLDSVSFFYKDTITMGKYQRAAFYKTLLNLRKANPALAANAYYRKIDAGNPAQIYAYLREKDGRDVLVVLNLSAKATTALITDKVLQGNVLTDIFTKEKLDVHTKSIALKPWGYKVYVN